VVYLVYTVEDKPQVFVEPTIQHRQQANLDNRAMLLGYDLVTDRVHPGDKVHLTLYWKALTRLEVSYTVFTHLVDAAGHLWGQKDSIPAKGSRPTTGWAVGEIIVDKYEILVSPEASPGEYKLLIGMYDLATMQRLPTRGEKAEVNGDRVVLGESIHVEGKRR